MVELLLESGADVHAANPDGSTALHYAAAFDHKSAFVALMCGGAHKDP